MPKQADTRLSVFKGREAKLNRCIFQIMEAKGSLAMWDLLREMRKVRGFKRTKYSVVNTRVRALETKGYLRRTGERKTKQGGETILYETTQRAKLAIEINSRSIDDLINGLDEDQAKTILEAIKRPS